MFKGAYSFQKTGRYFSIKELNKDQKNIWIVLHGYKQLSNFFLRKFGIEYDSSVNIIAPEGMHRFYLEGYRGRVGASWMTSEERESDIRDNILGLDNFLNEVLQDVHPEAKVNVLGFSQGAATAIRWVCRGAVQADHVVIWAGSFPPDIDFESDFDVLKSKNMTVVLGDEDEFFNDSYIQGMDELLKNKHVSFDVLKYKGGHDVYVDVFKSLIRNGSS